MPKEFLLFSAIGLLVATLTGAALGLLYYLAILHFLWYMTGLYAAILFLVMVGLFTTYAMFKAAVLGENDARTDEYRSF